MTTMHNPPHPGETLLEDVLPALGLTVTEAAAQPGRASRLRDEAGFALVGSKPASLPVGAGTTAV